MGLLELCLGTGDAVAGCTELSLASLAEEEHLGILRKVRAQGPSLHTGARVLEAMPDACPTCAGMVLDHLERVLMPETGHAPGYHSLPAVLFLVTLHLVRVTLHLARASFSAVTCEGEVDVGWSGSIAAWPGPLAGWLGTLSASVPHRVFLMAVSFA